ncbi:MAG: hypothetical protein ABI234_03405 [Ktedonobacteraceae bacterium]
MGPKILGSLTILRLACYGDWFAAFVLGNNRRQRFPALLEGQGIITVSPLEKKRTSTRVRS